MKVTLNVERIQFDNQMCTRSAYDFPVVLIGQNDKPLIHPNIFYTPISKLMNSHDNKLISIEANFNIWTDSFQQITITGSTKQLIHVRF